MPARTPGLTPTAERTLHARLAAEIDASDPARAPVSGLDALLPELTRIVIEALPTTPLPDEVINLVRRTQDVADTLRREGKAGLARDIDRLAGMLHGLAVDNANQAVLLDGYRDAGSAEGDAERTARLERMRALDPGRRKPPERLAARTKHPTPN